jgi:hypothetical protein
MFFDPGTTPARTPGRPSSAATVYGMKDLWSDRKIFIAARPGFDEQNRIEVA